MRNLAIVIGAALFLIAGCSGGTGRDGGANAPDGATPHAGDAARDAGVAGKDGLVTYTQNQQPCEDRFPQRRAYFGDLHVHTSYSFDAYAHQTRNDPADAYAFAQGQPVYIGKLDENGRGSIQYQLDRPLDFAAVTDHSELLGEVVLCTTEGSPGYDSIACQQMRTGGSRAVTLFAATLAQPTGTRLPGVCGVDGKRCVAAAESPWASIRQTAASANDLTSSCGFTAFVAYEWTGSPGSSTLHRNVIFRNDDVPTAPVSYFDESEPEQLRQRLDEVCTDREGRCQVLTIPHNSNASQGNAFDTDYGDAITPSAKKIVAERRARLEPLMEIFQHKGTSECYYKIDQPLRRYSDDPVCEFELLGGISFENPVVPLPQPRDFLRGALGLGLKEWQELGTNPLRLGVIASTDTHNGTPGAVEENQFRGHLGATEQDNVDMGTAADGTNPGGLVGVWAVERSRDALFEGMQRRETFGTSGPRIQPRFFGGWGYDTTLCEDANMLQTAYREGVPMGSTLPPRPDGAKPKFIVQAAQDRVPLSVAQVIKVWVDAKGDKQEQVFDVAGSLDNGAEVNLETCETTDAIGMANTCTVWTDPAFDPSVPAVYYVRVLENPSCRFNRWRCLQQNAAERPASCDEPGADPRSAQRERAWTSPIWYEPQ